MTKLQLRLHSITTRRPEDMLEPDVMTALLLPGNMMVLMYAVFHAGSIRIRYGRVGSFYRRNSLLVCRAWNQLYASMILPFVAVMLISMNGVLYDRVVAKGVNCASAFAMATAIFTFKFFDSLLFDQVHRLQECLYDLIAVYSLLMTLFVQEEHSMSVLLMCAQGSRVSWMILIVMRKFWDQDMPRKRSFRTAVSLHFLLTVVFNLMLPAFVMSASSTFQDQSKPDKMSELSVGVFWCLLVCLNGWNGWWLYSAASLWKKVETDWRQNSEPPPAPVRPARVVVRIAGLESPPPYEQVMNSLNV